MKDIHLSESLHRPAIVGCSRVQKEISRKFFGFRLNGDAFLQPKRKGRFKNEKASSKI
jgi:hypothetical protein